MVFQLVETMDAAELSRTILHFENAYQLTANVEYRRMADRAIERLISLMEATPNPYEETETMQ